MGLVAVVIDPVTPPGFYRFIVTGSHFFKFFLTLRVKLVNSYGSPASGTVLGRLNSPDSYSQ